MNRKNYDPSSLPEDIEDPKEKEALHKLAHLCDIEVQERLKRVEELKLKAKIRQHRMIINEKEFVKLLIAFNKDMKYIIYLGLNDKEFYGQSFLVDAISQKLFEGKTADFLTAMGINPGILRHKNKR